MITNNQLSDEEKNKLESRLFEIFLEALRKNRHENGSEKIWHDLLLQFFEENHAKHPSIFKSSEDFDLSLKIRMEEVDRVIEEKNVNYIVSCCNWMFPCTVYVDGICSIFRLFNGAIFLKPLAFCIFESELVEFVGTSFLGGLQISHHQVCKVRNIKFLSCSFGKSSGFMAQKFESFVMINSRFGNDVELIFKRTDFSEKVLLIDHNLNPQTQGLAVCELDLEHTIFDCSLTCSLKLKKCPDFSKSSLLRSKIIEETWQIDEKKISPEDEPKFRFLKKYFAEQGNHFKEQQYFSYEMEAKRQRLLKEAKIPYLKNFLKKLQNSSPIFLKKLMLKIVSIKNFLKNFSDLILFILYKWTSNFGMSWFRPLFCLLISFCYFGYFFKEINLENPYIKSFVRTFNLIFPLTSDVERFPLLMVFLTIQSLLNGCLIFLLILGLRNKFKIK